MKWLRDYRTIWFPGKVALIQLPDRVDWTSLKRCWECYIPKYKNWSRFELMTPFFSFSISGWIFGAGRENES